MTITNEDARKNVRLIIKNNDGTIEKVVDLQNLQIGTTSSPKDLDLLGAANVGGNLIVDGLSIFGNHVLVAGSGTFGDSLYVTGSGTFGSNLVVAGSGSFQGSLMVSGTLSATRMTGSIQRVPSGRSYIVGTAGITVTSQSSGQIYVANPQYAYPNEFSGLKMWFEAAAGNVTLDNSNPTSVKQWTDLSGQGNHLAQVTKATQPRWNSANSLLSGSQPSLELQGAQYLSSSNLTLSTFTVILGIHAKSNSTIFVEHSANAGANNGSWIYGGVSGGSGGSILVRRNSTNSTKDHPLGANWASNDDWPTIWTQIFNGTHKSHRLEVRNWDATMTDGSAVDVGTTSTTQQLFVGARSGGSLFASGSLFALAVYTPALSPWQAMRVARYFAEKFGIGVM